MIVSNRLGGVARGMLAVAISLLVSIGCGKRDAPQPKPHAVRGDDAALHEGARRFRLADAEYLTAREHVAAALEAEEQRLVNVAQAQYEKALGRDPQCPEAHAGIGRCAMRLGHYDEAIGAFRMALELAPGRPGWRLDLGNGLYAKGDLDGAMAEYRKALELKPGFARAWEKTAVVHWKRRDYESATAAIATCKAMGGEPDEAFAKQLEQDLARAGRPERNGAK